MRRIRKVEIWPVALADIVLMCAALYVSILIRFGWNVSIAEVAAHYRYFTPIFVAWLAVFFSYSLFEVSSLRRYVDLVFRLLSAMAVNALIAVAYFYSQPNLSLTPRRFLILEVSVTFLFLLAFRLLLKYLLRSAYLENIYIYAPGSGARVQAAEIAHEITAHSYMGFRFRETIEKLDPDEMPCAQGAATSIVLMSDGIRGDASAVTSMYELRRRGIGFYYHRDFYETLLRRVYLPSLDEVWFVENVDYQRKIVYSAVKRAIDVAAGLVFLVLFAVSYPFVALATRLSSSGPVMFRQKRVGQLGNIFLLYKYRTMVTGDGCTWTTNGDPRITRFGNLLRKSRIDELPQAFNLLSGDMSLVGPRPEQVGIVAELSRIVPFYDERHLAKPGLTGWAQLHTYAGSIEETKLKLEYDLYYIGHRSVMFDLEVILKTVYYMFTFKGR